MVVSQLGMYTLKSQSMFILYLQEEILLNLMIQKVTLGKLENHIPD